MQRDVVSDPWLSREDSGSQIDMFKWLRLGQLAVRTDALSYSALHISCYDSFWSTVLASLYDSLTINSFWWLTEFLWSWITLHWKERQSWHAVLCILGDALSPMLQRKAGGYKVLVKRLLCVSLQSHILEQDVLYVWEREENIPKFKLLPIGKNNLCFHPQFPFHFYSLLP